MKLKYWLFAFFVFGLFIPSVFAAPYYYRVDSGNYLLCDGTKCDEVEPGKEGVTFNLAAGQITYNGIVFQYNAELQETYYESMIGQTRMFYYIDDNDRYVLCTQVGSCERYSFDTLSSQGAVITTGSTITMEDGTTYYYNSIQSGNSSNEESSNNNSNASDIDVEDSATCGRLKEPLMFIGNIVLVVKIAIPIIIIALGMMDFFKAITGSKDEEIKKAAKSFVLRVAAGAIIFFIPTVISVVFSLISSWADLKGEFNACQKCILNVRSCE